MKNKKLLTIGIGLLAGIASATNMPSPFQSNPNIQISKPDHTKCIELNPTEQDCTQLKAGKNNCPFDAYKLKADFETQSGIKFTKAIGSGTNTVFNTQCTLYKDEYACSYFTCKTFNQDYVKK